MASHATCFLRRLGMDLPFPGLGFRIDWGFGGSIQGFWGRAYPPLPYRPKPNSKPAPTQTLGLREGRAGPSPETWIDPLAPREGWVGVEKTGTDPCHPSLRDWEFELHVYPSRTKTNSLVLEWILSRRLTFKPPRTSNCKRPIHVTGLHDLWLALVGGFLGVTTDIFRRLWLYLDSNYCPYLAMINYCFQLMIFW